MSETVASDIKPSTSAKVEKKRAAPLRPAKPSDIDQIHTWLMEAIDSSPFYNDTFKAFEKGRLTKDYLRQLHDADPAHLMLMIREDEPVGFMISGPELGTLWLYWSYLIPEKRRSTMAMSAMRGFIDYWDNGRFHKIATYTKHGNEPAEAIMRRFGFKHICTLEKHVFGEDYLLYECALNKTSQGYDRGIGGGFFSRIKRMAKRLLGF